MRQGEQTNTVPARYFWKTASFIEENVAQKFDILLGRPTLLLFVVTMLT